MKTRWKIVILVGAFLVLLVITTILSLHSQSANQVDAYKKMLRDRGEKLEIGDLLPPPVPAESNSVDAVEEAFRLLGLHSGKIPDIMKMVAPGKAMAAWMQLEVQGSFYNSDFTNSWDDFAIDLAADRPALELLHQVLARPKLDFHLDYKRGADMLLPHLAPMKHAAQTLAAASVLDLHNADTAAAATNILTMLGLVERSASDPMLISHLVRIAITSIAVAPTWELLQATNATDAQLAAVQHGWEQLDFLDDAASSFSMERAWGLNEISKIRASREEFDKMLDPASMASSSSGSASGGWGWEDLTEKPRIAIGKAMWRSSWSYSDELRTLQSGSVILEALRGMQTNQSEFYRADYDRMTTCLSSLGITNAGAALFQALKIPDMSDMLSGEKLGSVVLKTLRIETARRMVVTAIALKRFQSQHGKLPETLGALVPEFLKSVPIDPNDGKPLHYYPNADGTYLLYSVGDDGKDDGGDPTVPGSAGRASFNWQNTKARDFVWPQPATPAEINYFYEHPPK